MASKCTQKLSDMVTCPICLEVLKNPKMLKCFHFFCHDCLFDTDKVKEGRKTGFNCSLCRQFTAEDELQVTPFMHDLLDAFELAKKDELPCSMCEKELPIWRCIECKCNYCVTCRAGHDKIPMCANHKCVSLEETSKTVCVDKLVFCKVHPEKQLELNCSSCNKVICVLCKAIDHEGHKAETISDALERILPDLNQHTGEIAKRVQLAKERVNELNKQKRDIESHYNQLQKQADDKLEEVIRKAKEEHTEVSRSLEAHKNEELQDIDKAVEELELDINSKETIISWTNTTLEAAQSTSLLQELQSGLRDRITSMSSESVLHTERKLITGKVKLVLSEPQTVIGRVSMDKSISRFIPLLLGEVLKPILKLENKQIKDCYRFTLIDSELWCVYLGSNLITVLSLDLETKRSLMLPTRTICRSVVPVNDGIMLAAQNGIYLLDKDGNVLQTIANGAYSDVSVSDGDLCSLEYQLGQVKIFHRSNSGQWLQTATHRITDYTESPFNTIQAAESGYYVCVRERHCVQKHTGAGKLVQRYGAYGDESTGSGYLNGPRICGIDSAGDILVADLWNQRIQALKSDGSYQILVNNIGSDTFCTFPDKNNSHLYVATRQSMKMFTL